MDIGIDLGTTFSVIGVKGQVETVSSYPQGRYLEECDVTLLPTPDGDYTFPSVLWWHPDEPDQYIVGMDAKLKADEGCTPIMFSKRAIGTGEKLKMNGREFTAKEVAVHILKYLKACAEQALGEPVHRAVVTHPAHFAPYRVQETLEAAIEAGFDMKPEQMLLEPCAAALAYTQSDDRDPLRVLTYDLGGGTFDVAVLEKREGVITMKAFEGNDLLGGYNFDRAFVQWVLDRLKTQNRTIPYDEENEEDRGRRSQLLQFAEQIKEKLTSQRTSKVTIPIKINFLVDDQGRRVQFIDQISREQYTDLIKEELDNTIECCRRALAKANIDADDLDAVLLVGGSTYGQWVQEAVENAFGSYVEPYNPDLCVAVGAAMEAAKLPIIQKGSKIDLSLEVHPTSALPSTNVCGTISPCKGSELDKEACRQLIVMLDTPTGKALGPAEISNEGKFIFKNVALLEEEEPTDFTIRISENDREITSENFTITYEPETGGTEIYPVMPRPLYLRTANGITPVTEEGKTLPAKCEIRLKKLFGDSSVKIPVLLDSEEVGAIQVDDIPEDAGEGSLIIVNVEVTQKNEMKGTVQVKTRTGTVAKEGPVRIAFPPPPIPDLSELRSRFEDLKERLEIGILNSSDPQHRLALQGAGKKLIREIEKKFAEQKQDKQEIHRALKELDHLVNPPADDMDPPRTEFRGNLEVCRELIASKPDDPGIRAFQPQLVQIENQGNDAYATKNKRKWSNVNDALRQLRSRIERIVTGGNGPPLPPPPPPPTEVQKAGGKIRIDQMRSSLRAARDNVERQPDYDTRWRPRCEKLERALDTMEKAVDRISNDLPPEQCQGQIQLAFLKERDIKEKISFIEKKIETGKN